MTEIIVFVVVFGLAGAFFLWLRRLGRRMQAGRPTTAAPAASGDGGDELAENLGFAAETAARLARGRSDRRGDGAGDGAGDGGDGGGGE